MRVTFLLPRYGWQASGGFRVVYTYAGLLAERGHTVHVVHPRCLPPGGWPRPASMLGHARRAGGRVRDVLLRPRLDWMDVHPSVQLSYVPELAPRHVPDGDAIIATWWSTAEAALALPARKGKRVHLIQGYEVWYGAEERVHAAWRAPLHKVFVARWLLELALELGVAPAMTSWIPNAVDLHTFRLVRPMAERGPRVAMLYSPETVKGGALGVEILKRVKTRVPELTAVLFGVVREPRDLPSWITYIRHASHSQLADDVYNRAAVYLCPSRSEGWHLPPAEAMACGCAVVGPDIGGLRDYAVDGETALLYPAGDVAAGADRVVALLADDAARLALATRGQHAIARFSWECSGDRFAALLEELTGP